MCGPGMVLIHDISGTGEKNYTRLRALWQFDCMVLCCRLEPKWLEPKWLRTASVKRKGDVFLFVFDIPQVAAFNCESPMFCNLSRIFIMHMDAMDNSGAELISVLGGRLALPESRCT